LIKFEKNRSVARYFDLMSTDHHFGAFVHSPTQGLNLEHDFTIQEATVIVTPPDVHLLRSKFPPDVEMTPPDVQMTPPTVSSKNIYT